jgi:hypothetical protein
MSNPDFISWEDLWSARVRMSAENDALKLRVAVLEKALEEVGRKAHTANNRCQAVVNVCETAIARVRRVGGDFAADLTAKELEAALQGEAAGVLEKLRAEAAQVERAAIIRKIRQDARIAEGLASFSGNYSTQQALYGLADDLEAGAREQTGDDDE